MKQYCVIENGEIVFKGNRNEVAEKVGISVPSIYEYLRTDKIIHDRYYLIHEGENNPVKMKKKKVEPTKREQNLEYLLTHLRIYGNVSSTFDPVPYLPDLYELGLNCSVQEVVGNMVKSEIAQKSTKHKRKDVFYITEVRS